MTLVLTEFINYYGKQILNKPANETMKKKSNLLKVKKGCDQRGPLWESSIKEKVCFSQMERACAKALRYERG